MQRNIKQAAVREHMGEWILIPKDAETIADAWVRSNMRDVLGVSYGVVAKHGEHWLVRGEAELWRGLFESERVRFEMEISPAGEILRVSTEPAES